jgi:uncharacterized membrane protein
VGLRKNQLEYFKTGLATLVLIAIKLLVIDFSNLNVIWRILIFMGFGGVFLFLSYWIKDLWNMKTSDKPTRGGVVTLKKFHQIPFQLNPFARKVPTEV